MLLVGFGARALDALVGLGAQALELRVHVRAEAGDLLHEVADPVIAPFESAQALFNAWGLVGCGLRGHTLNLSSVSVASGSRLGSVEENAQ